MLKKIFMGVCCIIVAFTFSGCNKIPAIEQTTGDYILNISVSATTFNEGEEIEVAMTFENNSGEEQQIIHPFPMITAFVIEEGSYGFGDSASYITLAQGTTIKESFFGSHLKKGKYHLIGVASFSLGWEYGGEEIIVYSNTIIIIVK